MFGATRNNPVTEDLDIQVAGFKSNIINFKKTMNDTININSDCTVQLMDADGIAGTNHAVHAAIHAIKSFARKENISNDLGLEILVRASGQRQISEAIKMLGIKNGEMNICTVTVGCESNIMDKLETILGRREDTVLEPDDFKLKNKYNISDIEEESAGSVSKILMERTALLILQK